MSADAGNTLVRFAARWGETVFEDLLDSAPDAMIVADERGHILFANAQAERMFGWTRAELTNMRVEDLMPQDYRERHVHHRREFGHHPRTRPMGSGLELRGLRRNGGQFPVEISLSPLKVGERMLVSAAIRDITSRRETEEALRDAEARFRNAFQFAPIGMALVSLEGRWVEVNPALCDIVGYSEAELTQLTFQQITHPDDLEKDLAYARKLLEGSIGSYELEKRYIHADGHSVWVLLSGSIIRTPTGQPRHFIAQIQDISARKQTEDRLRLSEARLAEAQKLAEVGSWEWNLRPERVILSDQIYRLYGLEPGDAPADASVFMDPVPPEDRRLVEAALSAATRDRKPFAFDHRIRRPDGAVRWIHARGEVETDSAGEPVRLHGTSQDVTERRAGEERIRASLQEKEALLREIHHRVKNNLQIVSSLLSLQSGSVSEPAAASVLVEGRNRIRSMAMVHERLYQSSNLAQIDLGDYLRGLSQEVVASYGAAAAKVALQLDLEQALVGIDVAINCGLIVNELLSNCLKHAFPDGRSGRIAVRLTAEQGALRLTIGDDGVGLPASLDIEDTATMGLQLVTTLARQLDADLSVVREHGTRFELRFVDPGREQAVKT